MHVAIVRWGGSFNRDALATLRILSYARQFVGAGMQVTFWHDFVGDKTVAQKLQSEVACLGVDLHLVRMGWLLRRLFSLLEGIFRKLHLPEGWLLLDVRVFSWLVRRAFLCNRPECVIVSAPGFYIVPRIAKISQEIKSRFVIDFRDTPDELDPGLTLRTTREKVDMLRDAVRVADLIVTVSSPLVGLIKERYGVRNVYLVMHGYEGTIGPVVRKMSNHRNKFVILYTGVLSYGRDASLHLVFGALDKMRREGCQLEKIDFLIAGDNAAKMFEQFSAYESYLCLKNLSVLPRREAVVLQSQADVLLSVSSPQGKGILTSKLFEYAKAGRPILSIPKDRGVIDQFIERSGLGLCCDDLDSVASYLSELLEEWERCGDVTVRPNYDYLSTFSRDAQSKALLERVKRILTV